MPFTSDKRKEYSSTILSKISSLEQDEKSIASQQQSAIDSYDDSTSDDYSNRKQMMDSQDTLMGAARELCYIDNYYIDSSSLAYRLMESGYINIGSYITDYGTEVLRKDGGYVFSALYKYSSDRKKGVVNNSAGIYQSELITPDSASESTSPLTGSAEYVSSSLVKYSKDASTRMSISESISAMSGMLSSMFPGGAAKPVGIDYSSKDSYKILKYMKSGISYPTFTCSGSGIYDTATVSVVVDKYNDCISSFPDVGSYIICSNAERNYYQIARIISIVNEIIPYEYDAWKSGIVYIYKYTLKMRLKVVTNNSPYYYASGDGTGKVSTRDTVLYPYAVVNEGVLYDVMRVYIESVKEAVASAYSAFSETDKSCRITEYSPEPNYKSMLNALSSADYSDIGSLYAVKRYLEGMYNGFLKNRKKILLETINDTVYTDDLINSLNGRLDKSSGSLISWYGDLLSTDDMYRRHIAKISSNASYFKRMGVLKVKVDPGKEVFHSIGNDGVEKIDVDTYSSYASSQGSTADEVLKWMNSNPDSRDAQYCIYCEKEFNEYYSKAGVSASINPGDVIYIMDDSVQETKTTVAEISYDKIPSGASISGTSSSASITYEEVMRIKCTNIIPTKYSVDNNLRVVKEL